MGTVVTCDLAPAADHGWKLQGAEVALGTLKTASGAGRVGGPKRTESLSSFAREAEKDRLLTKALPCVGGENYD